MAKITSLITDSGISYCFDKAMKKCDAGDYVGGIDLLFTARKLLDAPYSKDDLSLLLEIADTYSEMGLFEESNRYYFHLLPYSFCLDDIYYGLIRNFVLMNDPKTALYYLDLGLEMGLLDPKDSLSPDEIEDFISGKQNDFHVVRDNDTEYMMEVARQLMTSDNTDFAKEILSSVRPGTRDYATAANYLAIIEIKGGNPEEGVAYCDSVLELDPDNVGALTAKIIGRYRQGRTDEVESLTERLSELDFDDMDRLNKSAICMAEIGNSEYTAKFCEKMLAIDDCERNAMLLGAQAYFNMGNLARAKELIVSLCSVYRGDYTAKYYARLIESGEVRPLPLLTVIDSAERIRRIALIDELIARAETPDDFVGACIDDERVKDVVMWGLYEGGDDAACRIITEISGSRLGYKIARDLLLDPECSVVLKKTALYRVFKAGYAPFLQMVVGNKLFWLRPVMPKVTQREEFTDAYWRLYSALAFIETEYDRKLNTWYRKVAEALADKDVRFEPAALAALIAFRSRISKIFEAETHCLEVFDCNREDFVLYSDMLDDVLTGGKSATKRAIKAGIRTKLGNKKREKDEK